jgi:hypothetical protein
MRMICSSRFCLWSAKAKAYAGLFHGATHLEALVLQHSLDGRVFTAGRQFGLEDDAEGAIADDLALCIGQVFVLARQAVLHFLADDFCEGVSMRAVAGRAGTLTTHSQRGEGRWPVLGHCSGVSTMGSAKRARIAVAVKRAAGGGRAGSERRIWRVRACASVCVVVSGGGVAHVEEGEQARRSCVWRGGVEVKDGGREERSSLGRVK